MHGINDINFMIQKDFLWGFVSFNYISFVSPCMSQVFSFQQWKVLLWFWGKGGVSQNEAAPQIH